MTAARPSRPVRCSSAIGGTTGSLTGDVLNNAILAVNRSDTTPFAGNISGNGAIPAQRGTGTTILTGTNSYAGGTADFRRHAATSATAAHQARSPVTS